MPEIYVFYAFLGLMLINVGFTIVYLLGLPKIVDRRSKKPQ